MPKVTISIPQDIYEKVKVQAERNGMSVSEYAKQAILTMVRLDESREQALRDLMEWRQLMRSIRPSQGFEEAVDSIKKMLERKDFLENYMAGLKSIIGALRILAELQGVELHQARRPQRNGEEP